VQVGAEHGHEAHERQHQPAPHGEGAGRVRQEGGELAGRPAGVLKAKVP